MRLNCVPVLDTIVTAMSTTKKDTLSAALFGKTRRAVLAALYGQPGRELYLRELARSAGVGLGAVQRELRRLCAAGVIERAVQGRQVYFRANEECPIFPELRGLVLKTAGIAEALRAALEPLSDKIAAAFVYGSVASGEAGADSDVDLLVVGAAEDLEVHAAVAEAEAALGRVVDYTLMTRAEFRRRRREKGGFLARVLAGPKTLILGHLDALR
ncbi:MAG: ArsR family transcriptional regulator [Planctomycetes bacterium]|nr:ArsR family transcriptional regulator [Planctomycetota bacterium]